MQPVFCLFALIDISKQDVPTDDATFRVPHGKSTNLKPTVNPIGTPATVLNVIGMPGFDRARERGEHAREVIRVNGVGRGPTPHLLSRPAEIFQDLAVEGLDFALRIHGTHKPRNAIDDQAQIKFART